MEMAEIEQESFQQDEIDIYEKQKRIAKYLFGVAILRAKEIESEDRLKES
jgi:hypothetical protein